MRIVLASAGAPLLPMSILLSPVVRSPPAKLPNPMLLLPVVLLRSASKPVAVLPLPVLFLAVEAQEVVHGGVEFGDGWMMLKSAVWSMPVVMVEEGAEISGTDV